MSTGKINLQEEYTNASDEVRDVLDRAVTVAIREVLSNVDAYGAIFQQALKELPSVELSYIKNELGCNEIQDLPFYFLWYKIFQPNLVTKNDREGMNCGSCPLDARNPDYDCAAPDCWVDREVTVVHLTLEMPPMHAAELAGLLGNHVSFSDFPWAKSIYNALSSKGIRDEAVFKDSEFGANVFLERKQD